MRIGILCLLLVMLAGCQPAVMLKNDQTGQVVRCEGVGPSTFGGAFRYGERAECIHSFEQQGFKRQP